MTEAPFRAVENFSSWEWSCPASGEVVGPRQVPEGCFVFRSADGFVAFGLLPDEPPQLVGIFTSWDAAMRGCERFRAGLPDLLRVKLALHRREAWWRANLAEEQAKACGDVAQPRAVGR